MGVSYFALIFLGVLLITLAVLLGNRSTRPVGIAMLLLLALAGTWVMTFRAQTQVAIRQEQVMVQAQHSALQEEVKRRAITAKTAEKTIEAPSPAAKTGNLAPTPAPAEAKPESPAAAPPALHTGDSSIPPSIAARHAPVEGAMQVVVSAGPFQTRAEGEAELVAKIEREITHYVERYAPKRNPRAGLPLEYLRSQVVKEQWEQPSELTLGSGTVPMTTVFALLQFDHGVNARIDEALEEAVVQQRMLIAGVLLVELLALLTVVWLYLKIDLQTAGAYRWRLRLAAALAILLIVSVGLAGVG